MARPKGHRLSPTAWGDMLRTTPGASLTSIANASGIPRPTISGLVTGIQRASAPLAQKLAMATGFALETLFPSLSKYYVESPDSEAKRI